MAPGLFAESLVISGAVGTNDRGRLFQVLETDDVILTVSLVASGQAGQGRIFSASRKAFHRLLSACIYFYKCFTVLLHHHVFVNADHGGTRETSPWHVTIGLSRHLEGRMKGRYRSGLLTVACTRC